MKDTHLLPYILPNVFAISNVLSAPQFASLVLPSLKPLFTVKDPPQNMLTLLDNLHMLQSKTEKGVFREREQPNRHYVSHGLNYFQRFSHLCIMHWSLSML
jgi:SCY1-like protein 2